MESSVWAIGTPAGSRVSNRPMARSPNCTIGASHVHANHSAAYGFQHLHDLRLVWSPEISRGPAIQSDRDQLDDCLLRILLPGPSQPYRLLRIQRRATEDDSGGHHAGRVLSVFSTLSEAARALEPRRRIRHD